MATTDAITTRNFTSIVSNGNMTANFRFYFKIIIIIDLGIHKGRDARATFSVGTRSASATITTVIVDVAFAAIAADAATGTYTIATGNCSGLRYDANFNRT